MRWSSARRSGRGVKGEVKILPAQFTLESAYRSIPPLARPVADEEMVRIAKEERSQRTAKTLRKK